MNGREKSVERLKRQWLRGVLSEQMKLWLLSCGARWVISGRFSTRLAKHLPILTRSSSVSRPLSIVSALGADLSPAHPFVLLLHPSITSVHPSCSSFQHVFYPCVHPPLSINASHYLRAPRRDEAAGKNDPALDGKMKTSEWTKSCQASIHKARSSHNHQHS